MNPSLLALLACLSGHFPAAAEGGAAASLKVVGVIADLRGEVRWRPPRKRKPDILDELHPGDSILVGEGGSVSLLYYAQCRQEVVAGANEARIGTQSSSVSREDFLTAAKAPCDPPGALLDQDVSPLPGSLILRGANPGGGEERKYFDALDDRPGDVGVLLSYAAFCDRKGRFDEAERQYFKAQGLRPLSPGIKLRLADARAAAALSRLESALAAMGTAEPERPSALIKGSFAAIRPRLAGRRRRFGEISRLLESRAAGEGPAGLLVFGEGSSPPDKRALLDSENADRGAILDALSPPADRQRLGRLFSEIRGRYGSHGE